MSSEVEQNDLNNEKEEKKEEQIDNEKEEKKEENEKEEKKEENEIKEEKKDDKEEKKEDKEERKEGKEENKENKEEKEEKKEDKEDKEGKEEKKDPEENKNIDYSKLDKNELIKNNAFVKDLFKKLEVLKKGIVEERKKTTILITKIKQLEAELNNKTNEINQLIERINQETPKQEEKKNNNQNNAKDKQQELALSLAQEEIRKLNEQIINLKLEQESNNNKMKKTLEETEELKQEYQKQIKLLSEANDSLIKEYKTLKAEKANLDKDFENLKIEVTNQSRIPPPEMVREREILIREKDQLIVEKEQLIREKDHFEELIKEFKKSKEEAVSQMEACLKKNEELTLENQTFRDSIFTHESNAGKMAQKLAEFKNMVLTLNLRNQVFHVKKLGILSHNEIDIIFGKSQDGDYVMRIDEKNNSDVINILDVESVNQNEKKKNKVDISYMYKSKKYNISVLVNELVVDQFVEAYKNFYSESMKLQNKVI